MIIPVPVAASFRLYTRFVDADLTGPRRYGMVLRDQAIYLQTT